MSSLEEHQEARPKAVAFFRFYTAFVSVLYFAVMGLGIYCFLNPEFLASLEGVDPEKARLATWIYCGIGLVFGLVFAAGPFLKARPTHWLAGALLIAMSLGICVTAPFGFPLFYFWLQPEVRHWFGRD